MSRRVRQPGPLNQARRIKSVQRVQLPVIGISSAGLRTVNQEISPVDLAKSTVELIGEFTGHYYSGSNNLWARGGVYLSAPHQVTLQFNASNTLGGPHNVAATAQVIEYFSKPKSLQNIQGDGTSSQAINPVNVARAIVVPAYLELSGAYVSPNYNPVLATNSLSWLGHNLSTPCSFNQYQRVQIVEFD